MAAKAPLALIHTTLRKAGEWRGFLDALGPSISPRQIELPGHGLAPDWDRSRDFADQALEIALEEMPDEEVPLIGHGFGAVLALRIAIERPYRVKSLVLVEPIFFAAVKGRWSHDKLRQDLTPFERKMQAAQFATAAKDYHALWGEGRPWAELPTDMRHYITDRIELVQAGRPLVMEDEADLLRKGRLEKLEMPVTFVDGGASHPVIADIISELGDRIPDAEWFTVPDAGHMLTETHPAMLAQAVRKRLFG